MALTNVIALLEGQAGESARLTRLPRGQTTTSQSLSVDAAVHCESKREVDEVSNSFTRAQAHARAWEGDMGGQTSSTSRTSSDAPPSTVILLRHCRCMDCRSFSKVNGEYFCSEYIGGTAVVWATGKRQCDPSPAAWHYCACYHGPQISKDVWGWRRENHGDEKKPRRTLEGPAAAAPTFQLVGGRTSRKLETHCTTPVRNPEPLSVDESTPTAPRSSRHVPPGSTIAPKAANPTATRQCAASIKVGKVGKVS